MIQKCSVPASPTFFCPINLTQIEAKGWRRVANEIPPELHNGGKNDTDSQRCLGSILCCGCIRLVYFLDCRSIKPIAIFMELNNQSFKSLQPSTAGPLHKVIAASLCYSGCWLLGNSQRNSFQDEGRFHTSQIFSFRAPTPQTLPGHPEGHWSLCICWKTHVILCSSGA